MKKIAWMCWLCLFSTYPLHAQDDVERYSDSLVNSAMRSATDELKIEGLLNVSLFWSDRDTAHAYQYLNQAHTLMGRAPTNFNKGLYHLYRANILSEYDDLQAKAEYKTADTFLAKDRTQKSYRYRSKLWNNYAIIIQQEDKGAAYMELIINKALPYAKLAGDSAAVGLQLQNMALQLGNIQDYAKAADYYKAAIHAMRNMMDKYENKIEIYTNAARNELFLRNFDQAGIYLDSARQLMPHIPYSTLIPTFYRTELAYFRHTKNKKKALISYHKGISAAQRTGDEYMLRDINFELYALYRDFGDYQLAKKYLMISNTHEPFPNLGNSALYHQERAKLEYKLGNYKSAYHQMDSLTTKMDSIFGKDIAAKVIGLEQQYKTTEKENRILRLKATNQQQELAIARSRKWEFALGTGLLLTLCIAFFSWKINRNNKKLLAQKELLHQEELRSVRQQERLLQYDAMLQGQEAERNRLARDLHDGLGGLLAGVKLKLSSIVTKSNGNIDKSNGAVHEVIHQLDYSVDELRRIAHDMMPESLRYGGVVPALSDLCRLMESPKIRVQFQSLELKDNYPDHLRIMVYRIVQELLTNALKHADASKVILQCSELDGWLFITVEDNGKGLESSDRMPSKGLGLMNIHNRLALLNGNLETQSHAGEGTTFNIQIPL